MTPVEFSINGLTQVTYAKNQPEYLPLPACVDSNGVVVTKWHLTLRERLRLMFSSHIYIQKLTFNQPLQPIRVTLDEPEAV
jgi:hypothetical protein